MSLALTHKLTPAFRVSKFRPPPPPPLLTGNVYCAISMLFIGSEMRALRFKGTCRYALVIWNSGFKTGSPRAVNCFQLSYKQELDSYLHRLLFGGNSVCSEWVSKVERRRFWLRPSSGILNTRRHDVSANWTCFRPQEVVFRIPDDGQRQGTQWFWVVCATSEPFRFQRVVRFGYRE
jgi:hypothetical protein